MKTFLTTITFDDSLLAASSTVPDTAVFFDIETTGFRPATSHLYLIGAAWKDRGEKQQWQICQWFSEDYADEKSLLNAFSTALKDRTCILHFNGDRFDLPYLEEKYAQYQIPSPFSSVESRDLYREFRILRTFLGLLRMNQKSLECFLGLEREDRYDGGGLIRIYRQYLKKASSDRLHLLLLHNLEDVKGMMSLTGMYAYLFLYQSVLSGCLEGFEISCRSPESIPDDPDDSVKLPVLFSLPVPVPVPIRKAADGMILSLEKGTGTLFLPLFHGTLHYFFPDWKNYDYLPLEDRAIHRSVSRFVEKQYRQKATPDNCYVKKDGIFLPQWEPLCSPAFRICRNDSLSWFLYEKEMMEDSAFLRKYLLSCLQTVFAERSPINKEAD